MKPKKRGNGKVLKEGNRARFIRAFSECGTITEAARRAKVSYQAHYRWLAEDPRYKAEFETAKQQACDRLIEVARQRAHEGWQEPIVYQGEIQYQLDKDGNRTDKPVTVTKIDSTLLMFLIKGMRPEVFRENYKVDVSGSMITEVVRDPELSKLNLEQLRALKAIADQAAGVTNASNGQSNRVSSELSQPGGNPTGN